MQGSPRCPIPTGALPWAQRHRVPLPVGAELLVGGQRTPGSLGNRVPSPAPQGPLRAPVVERSVLTAPAQGSRGQGARGPPCRQLGSSLPASLGTGQRVVPRTALTAMQCAVCLSARAGCHAVRTELRYRRTRSHRSPEPGPRGCAVPGRAAGRGCRPGQGGRANRGWHRRGELVSTEGFKNKMVILRGTHGTDGEWLEPVAGDAC